MEKLEQLRRNTEKAYQAALKVMFLVDAITEERNYYRDLCTEKKSKGLQDQFSEECDKFINATWYNSIDKTPEEGEEVRIRIITNRREMEDCSEQSGERYNIYYDDQTHRSEKFEKNLISDGFRLLRLKE